MVVATLRGHGSVLADCSQENPDAVLEAVLVGRDDEAVTGIVLATGLSPAAAERLLGRLRERYGEPDVLEGSAPGSLLLRVRIRRHDLGSRVLRALLAFADRLGTPYARFERGRIEVRASGHERSVALAESGRMRAFLHKSGLAASVTVDDVGPTHAGSAVPDHFVPLLERAALPLAKA